MMGAAAALLGRRRRSNALSRAWRRWAGAWRRRRAAAEAEARAALEAALSLARGDARVRYAERAELEASLGRANLQLAEIVISSQLERAELGRRLSEMEAERGRSIAAREAAGVRVEAVRRAEAATHASELDALERLHREGLEATEAVCQRAEATARVAQAEKRQVRFAALHVHRMCSSMHIAWRIAHTVWHTAVHGTLHARCTRTAWPTACASTQHACTLRYTRHSRRQRASTRRVAASLWRCGSPRSGRYFPLYFPLVLPLSTSPCKGCSWREVESVTSRVRGCRSTHAGEPAPPAS